MFSLKFLLFLFIFLKVSVNSIYRKDWSSLDLEEVERQWNSEKNMDEMSPDDELFRQALRRRSEAMSRLQLMIDKQGSSNQWSAEFESLATEAQYAGKSAMIFAHLVPRNKVDLTRISNAGARFFSRTHTSMDSSSWDWNTLAILCEEWQVGAEDLMLTERLLRSFFPRLYHI